ncbi:MFS transporter [Mesorhizobium sp. M1C.F.Ca.ET.193.01.1.1]|uniref:MFS transporter n=1 Tax=unclassified Mesorhizobium TaxID=325217 RepID=UPI000FD30ED9|nr:MULTISPECIES: MFS transporter [unclassified Mesorhizobium]TGS94497.1 MFS transporter [bacterium M00.F.Ca.ET.177.01.1.1]TGQ51199.1 MFS transporter [Mesorhizobium sp. M1C.F.Ca.ET.210.01.1.1]TGQ66987.1 MFS transporter [Mesorhizobium sp. M1C.F.Ca.ET.212.01.1.1]TGR01110.1 MFS transporter [Mesorhizobium sp. M1C.F.Ca.ET.204.01.1.1]TGR21789.1 MFS transporter [Mesorhizobium sp. M1C.F.Ca.ET.196.01.1.1]
MTAAGSNKVSNKVDWRALWASGDLARFCFISLGILLHATNETMVATVMPAMVGELAGVQLVGWSLAVYELGAIVAGAAAGRLVSYVALRSNMMVAALLYAAGALICATAPAMPLFLVGRLVEGLGGGALVSLAFVSVERLFQRNIWPLLFGIMSAIWGVAAFSGPMLGALMTEFLSWRWAFGAFTFGGAAMALASFIVLDTPEATKPQAVGGTAPPFPYPALACLAVSVVLIAAAGINVALLRSSLLLALGLIGLALFFRIDALRPRSRLFPSPLFSWRSPLGSGMTMVAAFSVATCTFTIYGPLLLTELHDIPILTTGYIIAAESIAWSILSILIANAPLERERMIIVIGALMIASGLAGFAYAIPVGSIPLILLCALLQGGGFGVCWPFLTRVIVASARDGEQTIASAAVPTMQRIGYAVGAALAGIVANASGFSEGLNREAAADVAGWLFLAFVPLGIVGCIGALRIWGPADRPLEAIG